MRRISLSFLLSAFFFIGVPSVTLAVIPQPAGYVTDEAGLLTTEQVASLDRSLADYEKRTSNQVIVLTVKSLEGQDIESYSMAVAEAWKAGQKHKDNGVILLVAPNEKQVRIEVGYGLEGVLTDAKSARIIRNILAPHFQAKDYYGGITGAVSAMEGAIGAEFAPERAKTEPVPVPLSLPYVAMILFLAGLFGFISRALGAIAGAVLLGGLEAFTGSVGIGWVPAILLGLLLGALAPFLMKFFFWANMGRSLGGWKGSSRSGFGGLGGGGFSGGGGGFGGGGASGRW